MADDIQPRVPTHVSSPYFSVTCETEGVNYKYSTDGSEPSEVSVDLNEIGHFQIVKGSSMTIRIRAYKDGYDPSDIATCTYTPVTVPMSLPDGSVLFYDRGDDYGEYCIGEDGYPVRLTSGVDDGSAESANWRYFIAEEYDLPHYDSDVGDTTLNESYTGKSWGVYGTELGWTSTDIGTGLTNTNKLIETYPSETDYIWYYINKHRTETGKQWFLPSKDELNILHENKDTIGNLSKDSTYAHYWSSSEYSSAYSWCQYFLSGYQDNTISKNYTSYRVRLIRRI